jgi:hypothetical protein
MKTMQRAQQAAGSWVLMTHVGLAATETDDQLSTQAQTEPKRLMLSARGRHVSWELQLGACKNYGVLQAKDGLQSIAASLKFTGINHGFVRASRSTSPFQGQVAHHSWLEEKAAVFFLPTLRKAHFERHSVEMWQM